MPTERLEDQMAQIDALIKKVEAYEYGGSWCAEINLKALAVHADLIGHRLDVVFRLIEKEALADEWLSEPKESPDAQS